ncbi:MAG TPA: FAD-dependent oxidoreductase, partial [Gaiellaceae bacterium]|nr:FAD-dependent oxidoreductase [Gaiellaceae bacterium]
MTRVAVVGAGVMGCATAWALAGRGVDVTLHEQFEVDHARGSSHGRSRIVRFAYPEPDWVRLAEEARAAWRELEEATGQTLLELDGFVELATSPELTSHEALTACGVDHRLLPADEARALGVALPPGWCALEEATGGIIRADLARRALLETAIRSGVRFETGS